MSRDVKGNPVRATKSAAGSIALNDDYPMHAASHVTAGALLWLKASSNKSASPARFTGMKR